MPATTTVDERQILIDRVRRGAEHEDVVNPGWAARIDRTHLHMGSCFDCIIGQLHGNYIDAIADASPYTVDQPNAVSRWAEQHGFTYDLGLSMSRTVQFEALRNLWLAEIDRRLIA